MVFKFHSQLKVQRYIRLCLISSYTWNLTFKVFSQVRYHIEENNKIN